MEERKMLRSLFRGLLAALVACSALGGAVAFAQTDADAPVKDPRLDTKISLSVSNAKLADVAAKLSTQTGVAIRAGGSDREWRVREQKVTVTAKDVPLGSLMDELAGMLGFRVARGQAGGKFTYLIWQDKNSRELEADLMASQREDAARRSAESRQSALDSMEQALSVPEDQALAGKEKDPWMAYLAGTKAGRGYSKLLSAVCGANPDAKELILRGRRTVVSLEDLPPEAQQAAMDTAAGGFMAMQARQFPQLLEGMRPYRLTVMPMETEGGTSAANTGFGGMVMISGIKAGMEGMAEDMPFGGGIPIGMFPLAAAGTPVGKIFGRMLFAMESGQDPQEVSRQLMQEFQNPDVAAEMTGRKSKTEQNPVADPSLDREVELGKLPAVFDAKRLMDPERKSDAETLTALSEALGMPVLFECYPNESPIAMLLRSGKQPVRKIVVTLEKTGYTWEFQHGMLLIRPDDWAIRRAWMVPESFLARFKSILQQNGTFTLDNLGELAAGVTDAQMQNTIMTDPDLMFQVMANIGNPMDTSREMVRLYGSLNASQRTALKSEQGLNFAQFSDAQWDRLNSIIQDNLSPMQIAGGSMRLSIKETPEKPAAGMGMTINSFRVSVQPPGEDKPRAFTVSVMTYSKEMNAMLRKTAEQAIGAALGGQKKPEANPQEPKPVQPAPSPGK